MEQTGRIHIRKSFRKYKPFLTSSLQQCFAYKASFYLFIIADIFSVFISFYLWKAIYGGGSGTINGFSFQEMIIYIFMTYVTSHTIDVSMGRDLGYDVVEGNIAMNLIKPISYRTKLLFSGLGFMIYQFLAPSLLVWIGVSIYNYSQNGAMPPSVCTILLYLCSMVLSFLISFLFDFCFGMLAFVTTYIFGLTMAKAAVLKFITGQMIPLAFFPAVVQRVFDFLPFASMSYTPVMIYLEKYTGNQLLFALGVQIIWVILLFALSQFLWSRVTKRLTVMGG